MRQTVTASGSGSPPGNWSSTSPASGRCSSCSLDYAGTPFQRSVWDALRGIPYGTTTTYGALGRLLGAQPRAVGAAVGATPIPIIIPCHRVIGTDGSLTGYGGGLPRKRALLDFEAAAGDRSAFDAAWRQRQLALL